MNHNIPKILKTAMILYLIPAVITMLFALILLVAGAISYFQVGSDQAFKQILAGILTLLASLVFGSVLFWHRSRWLHIYYIATGGFVFLMYILAAFQSLLKIANPAMEFIILLAIACFGLWYVMLGFNPIIREQIKQNSPNKMAPTAE